MIGVVVRRVLTAAVALNVLLTASAGLAAPLPGWKAAPPVPIPKEATDGVLRDVSVVSPADVWIVGSWTGGGHHTLATHWDGATWTIAPTPDSSDRSNEYALNAVDAVASNDVWAVGGIQIVDNPTKFTPLFLHYDGIAWTEDPELAEVEGELTDIDLLSADDGWAIGTNHDLPFIVRRTATGWQPVPTPAFQGAVSLESVYATSPNDAWAVGFQQRANRQAALLLHWDGSTWSEVAIPDSASSDSALISIAATSASDVWAVGSQCSAGLCLPWVLHLARDTWQTERTAPGADLTSVVAFAADDVWIFGQGNAPTTALDHVEHWDGTRFTTDTNVPPASGNPHHPASALSLAAASGDRQTHSVWAVGWIQDIQKSTHAIYHN
jgi:hypothetical protein